MSTVNPAPRPPPPPPPRFFFFFAPLSQNSHTRSRVIQSHFRLARYEEAAQDRELLSHQLRTVTTDAEAAHRQFLVADADRRDLRERVDSLSRTLEEKTAAVNAARADRDKLKSELAACRAELDRERLLHSETAHELERARLKLESSVNEFALAVAANDEHRARTDAMCREIDQITVDLTRSERRREELEHDVGALRHDNEVMAARLESAARERAALAEKLSARTGPALHELATDNALLTQNLAETAALAEQLREQLLRTRDDNEDLARKLEAAIDLNRRTKAMLQEEERQIRRSGGFGRR
jgi:chromosome segregation ATPase